MGSKGQHPCSHEANFWLQTAVLIVTVVVLIAPAAKFVWWQAARHSASWDIDRRPIDSQYQGSRPRASQCASFPSTDNMVRNAASWRLRRQTSRTGIHKNAGRLPHLSGRGRP